MNPKKIKSGPAKQWMKGKDFRLAKEIKYIQRQAAEHDARFVTIDRKSGQIITVLGYPTAKIAQLG